MREDRLARVAAALAGVDGVDGERPIDRLVAVCVATLPISGASIAVIGNGEHAGAIALAGTGTAVVDDLQFSLGEGPCISAAVLSTPLLEPDLADAVGQWPAFAPAALALGVAAVFAFPLRVGHEQLGVLSLYASEAGELSTSDLADAIALARIATHVLLELEADLTPGTVPDRLAEVVDLRAEVHQATGVVAEQLGVDVAGALVRLRAHAWAHERAISDVARDVVSGSLRFHEE